MKALLVGDAVVSSGFSRCTHAVADALHSAGHEVHILGINYYGDPHEHPYKIYPCMQPFDGGRDQFGTARLPVLVQRLKPDVVFVLQDPWNIPAYRYELMRQLPEDFELPKFVAWLAVDAENQDGEVLNRCGLDHVVVWTEFAERELKKGGYTGEISIVPLGVDHDVFNPKDKAGSRSRTMPAALQKDAFIVGAVGRNQVRKRLDLTIEYFAAWLRSRPEIFNAYLYLHVGGTGEQGIALKSMVKYHGLAGKVILSQPDNVGMGADPLAMPLIYSALDVYLTTTQGEGWGLPALEAMACGVPVVAPDFSGLGSWAAPAARLVPCDAHAMTAPMNGALYTVGGIPSRGAVIDALDDLHDRPELRDRHRLLGLELAHQFSWGASGSAIRDLLEQIVPERVYNGPKRVATEG